MESSDTDGESATTILPSERNYDAKATAAAAIIVDMTTDRFIMM